MSLDVYLNLKGAARPTNSEIGFRERGQTVKMTLTEYQRKYPYREPIMANPSDDETDEVYWRNITHNLGKMAGEAGLYEALWRPDEIGVTKAAQLIEPLGDGLALLLTDPDRFKKLNPPNGWGDYDGLVSFVDDYRKACCKYPEADVRVSR